MFGHVAVLVEIELLVTHEARSRQCAGHLGLMETISIVELRGAAAGTMIMVATRRNAANDNPSIISSSVMTS